MRNRTGYTVIDGKEYEVLECVMRFERNDDEGSCWHIDGTCKRVGIRALESPRETTLSVQELRPEGWNDLRAAYTLLDSTIVTDTDGEDWIQTDLGLNCPRCMEFLGDLKVIEQDGINPFSGKPWEEETMENGDIDWGLIQEHPTDLALGRTLAVNPEVRSAAAKERARYGKRQDGEG